jgi:hypothetical protein
MLNRDPDDHGLSYYLGRLALGFSRSSVIVQLAKSSECKPHNEIIGLEKFMTEQKKANNWFWSFINRYSNAKINIQDGINAIKGIERRLASQDATLFKQYQALSEIAQQLALNYQDFSKSYRSTINQIERVDENNWLPAETVIQAFRAILEREPESEDTISYHRSLGNVYALLQSLIKSDEYRLKLGKIKAQSLSTNHCDSDMQDSETQNEIHVKLSKFWQQASLPNTQINSDQRSPLETFFINTYNRNDKNPCI